jgi:hypothetical protein
MDFSGTDKQQDYIKICGINESTRYGSNREIDLVNFLPDYLRDSDTEKFLQVFETFLNNMFDGYSGFSTSSEPLTVTKSYGTSGISASDRYYNYEVDSEEVSTESNNVESVSYGLPSNNYDVDPKISILEKVQRLTELHDPELIDINYIQFFAKNLGYNITVSRNEIGSENFGFDNTLAGDCSATEINKYLRFMVSNLPHWYKIKTTRNSIKVMLYSFGLIGDIVEYFSKEYSEDNPSNWSLDYNRDLIEIPEAWFSTPHFAIYINIDESQDLSFDVKKRDKFINAIESVRPINTVFRGLVGYFQRTLNLYLGCVIRFTRYIRIDSNGYSNSWYES